MARAGYTVGAAHGEGLNPVKKRVVWKGHVGIGCRLTSEGIAYAHDPIGSDSAVIPLFDVLGRDAIIVNRFETSIGSKRGPGGVVDDILEAISAEQDVARIVREVGIILHAPAVREVENITVLGGEVHSVAGGASKSEEPASQVSH